MHKAQVFSLREGLACETTINQPTICETLKQHKHSALADNIYTHR